MGCIAAAREYPVGMEERLQKIISRAGIASRRKAEELITAGRVKVNDMAVKELGAKADPQRDEIRVDGALISVALEPVYVMLNKPEGYVTTVSDPEGRPTVMNLVKKIRTRVYPVGRLDFATSGLLLLTSDGELTRFLTHPSSHVPKTYEVKVKGRIPPEAIRALREGPKIDKKPLKPAEVRFLKFSRTGQHSWLIMTIHEGRTRQIRRMCEAVGADVMKLKRVEIGPIKLGDLPPGDFRWLSDKEIALLKKLMKAKKAAK